MVKAESIYVKALMEIRRLRLSDTQFVQNQGLLSLQVTLINFVTSLATQHTEIITNLKDDVQSDLVENQAIQKTYRSHYVVIVIISNLDNGGRGEATTGKSATPTI